MRKAKFKKKKKGKWVKKRVEMNAERRKEERRENGEGLQKEISVCVCFKFPYFFEIWKQEEKEGDVREKERIDEKKGK